eukprot:g4577.t1
MAPSPLVKPVTKVSQWVRVPLSLLLVPGVTMLMIGLKKLPIPEEEGKGYPIFWLASIAYALGSPRNTFLVCGLTKIVSVIGMWVLPTSNLLICVFPLGLLLPTAVAAVMNYQVNLNTKSSGWFATQTALTGTRHPWMLPAAAAVTSLILFLVSVLLFFLQLREKESYELLKKLNKSAKMVKGLAGDIWEEAICPATGRMYWYNPKTDHSTYRDPTKEWKRDKTGRLASSWGVSAGGGKDAPKSSSLADILLNRRRKSEKSS